MRITYALVPFALALAAVGAATVAGCGDDEEVAVTPDAGPVVPPAPPAPPPPPPDGGPDGGQRTTVLAKGPSNGSSVALSPDESRVVVANRDKGSVTVFSVLYPAGATPTMTKVGEVDVGVGTEPWQVAIDPAGDRAYVALRQGQKLVRIDGINATPTKGPEAQVGSEPTGVALSPYGTHAYVTNWIDGTVSDVATETMTVSKSINLNAAIAPLLGTGLPARPSMAHPRSIAVSNNGDTNESDEYLYVTEYYAVRKEAETNVGVNANNADTSKGGVVYRVKVSNDNVETIGLGALANMGFPATPTVAAGCYPNQLQSITLNGKFAYVLSVCASPRGPLGVRTPNPAVACTVVGAVGNAECNAAVPGTSDGICQANLTCLDVGSVKTSTAPLLSVIDTSLATPAEVTAAATNLNKRFNDRYVAATAPAVPNDASRRLPLLANDLSFVPGTQIGYISANGTNAAFRAEFAADGSITKVGSDTPLKHFIDLTNGQPQSLANPAHGLLPTGLVAGTKSHLFVANDVSRNVSVVSLAAQTLAGGATPLVVESSAKAISDTPVLKGRLFFNTGLGRWSLRGQGWGACQSCHVDGLTDNVTWYFARGPRQTISLDASFNAAGTVQRIFNWTAVFDDVSDFEGNTRGTSGGVGAIVKDVTAPIGNAQRIIEGTAVAAQSHAGLNGSSKLLADAVVDQFTLGVGNKSVLEDWAEIEAYVKTIRAPRGARNLDAGMVTAGRATFLANNCQGCHGGTLWTTSEVFYTRTAATAFTTTEALATAAKTWTVGAFPLNISPNATTTGIMRLKTPDDSLLCALRQVGTFNVAPAAVGIAEFRADMTTVAQGADPNARGFSPPSLLGVSMGAPYLHAGSARSLEELFSCAGCSVGEVATFAAHHESISANFLKKTLAADNVADRLALIHFLLSIDDTTALAAVPVAGALGGTLCAP